MYRRILIAADPEGLAAGAAPAVVSLADTEGAQIQVITVGPHHGHRATPEGDDVVARLAREPRSRHLTVQVESREAGAGTVAGAIAAAAGEFDADLIVIGSHRRGGVSGFFVGSVGHALAAQVNTPILVVPSSAGRPPVGQGKVLVAVDGGELSREAVMAAAAISRTGTEVTAVYVDTPTTGMGGYPVYVDPTPTEVEGTRALEDAVGILRDAGATAHARRLYALDGTGAAIAREADEVDADLIVLGSRRPGNVEALLLGSVAQGVIAHTRRSVLLAPGVQRSNGAPAAR